MNYQTNNYKNSVEDIENVSFHTEDNGFTLLVGKTLIFIAFRKEHKI